jgi:hypothetical protein
MNIARQRLRTQHLLGPRLERPQDVVHWLTAVQAQDYPGAKWGLAQRLDGATDADIDRAFAEGAFLRTHVLRPTWHFVMPEDIRWMLELTAPRIKRTMASYDPGLELDEATYAKSNAIIEKEMRHGEHLTRSELGVALKDGGISGDLRRIAHIVMRAELEAIICSGAPRGKQQTYALLADRARNARTLPRDEALAELTRRYFIGHGPALPQDFAWWSGLTVADATAGLAMVKGDLQSEIIDGKTYWLSPTQVPANTGGVTAHLLPNYDEYLIAYRDRAALFYPGGLRAEAKFLSGVLSRHILVLDGHVIGGWYATNSRDQVTIEGTLLVQLNKRQQAALAEAVQAYGRFLGRKVISQLNSS